jgi:hypothetical protein
MLLVAGASSAFILALAAPLEAGAATKIGDSYTSSGGNTCSGDPGGTIIERVSPGNEYAAPFDGVITSWTNQASFWKTVTFKVARVGADNAYSVIGSDGPRTTPDFNVRTTYPVRISVRQGDVIGAHHPPGNYVCIYGGTGYGSGYDTADIPAGGSGLFEDTSNDLRVPIEATIEHDADHDGYGDETQDLCPTDPTLHSVCDTFPPQTSITKGPKKKTKSKKATFAFSSSEPGSTFECSLDGAAFHACASPMTATVKELGRHNFLVRARDTHGNLDTTEASWSWKVVKKKHRKHKR